MEPPAKRLRILQSVDVDETDPGYINAKQKQQRKFKGRLESIFAKYETMHESMSDEIDMNENKVVVDRGHLRRLLRQVNRKETVLLDNLGLEAGREPAFEEEEAESEKEDGDEDSEDELAPTQLPKSSKKEKQHQQTPAQKGASTPTITHSRLQPPQHPLMQSTAQPIPNTPNAAANLLQFVQFPQTPAGQQAQTSFYTSLAQTINQAVQQAVAPLFSSMLPNTPNLQFPNANPFAAFPTPVINNDNITPASDPKWFFPALPEEAFQRQATLPTTRPASSQPVLQVEQSAARTQEPMLSGGEGQEGITSTEEEPSFPVTAIIQSEHQANSPERRSTRRSSPRVEIQRKPPSHTAKYEFTEQDDVYIAKQKMLRKKTWAEIKNGKVSWRDLPVWVIQHRWSKQLKAKNLHLRDSTLLQPEHNHIVLAEDEIAHSPAHHLPTPSSLGQEDTSEEVDDQGQDLNAHVKSSSAHFDDDERDLLSLAGADLEEEQLPDSVEKEEEEAYFPTDDEMVLPSVESNECIDEDTLQQDLLDDSPLPEVPRQPTPNIKAESAASLPTRKRKHTQPLKAHQVAPASAAELANNDNQDLAVPEPPAHPPLTCPICHQTYKTPKTLHRHQANSRSTHAHLRPQSRSPSIDLVGADELQSAAPTTPHIKREVSTPPATSFLFSTPAPAPVPRRDGVNSSGAKGTSRKAYLQKVKQSWARGGTPSAKTVYKRRSFHTLPKKRVWGGESEDDLGM